MQWHWAGLDGGRKGKGCRAGIAGSHHPAHFPLRGFGLFSLKDGFFRGWMGTMPSWALPGESQHPNLRVSGGPEGMKGQQLLPEFPILDFCL